MISTTIIQDLNASTGWTPPLTASPAVQLWQLQRSNYRKWWNWYSGEELQKIVPNVKTDDGSIPYVYPLRVNPVQWVCSKHTAALFGEVPDYSDTNFEVGYVNVDGKKDERTEFMSDLMTTIWSESNGREIQLAAATASQFLGGCFFMPRWEPWNKNLSYGIRFEHVIPDFVLPIYAENDPWNILECWVMYYISAEEARLRYQIEAPMNTPKVLYAEHWTKDKYEVLIDGSVAKMKLGDTDIVVQGENPWGEVPLVYVPHPPRVGTYYGMGHVDEISGLVEELNRRLADTGDLVQDQSYRLLAMKNVTSKVSEQRITAKHNAVNLGTTGMTTGKEPDLWEVSGTGSDAKINLTFVEKLMDLLDRAAHLSPVAYGEDEGSQRSGVTLAARMWPLASHIRNERAMWTAGMKMLHRLTARMLKIKNTASISEADLKLKPQIGWFSMLPLDRQALVDEAVQRKTVGLLSTEDGVSMLSDGADVEDQVARIREDAEIENQMAMDLAKAKPAPSGGFGA